MFLSEHTKLKGNTCFTCGKKNCYVNICLQKDNTPHAECDINKKKTDEADTIGVRFAAVH